VDLFAILKLIGFQ